MARLSSRVESSRLLRLMRIQGRPDGGLVCRSNGPLSVDRLAVIAKCVNYTDVHVRVYQCTLYLRVWVHDFGYHAVCMFQRRHWIKLVQFRRAGINVETRSKLFSPNVSHPSAFFLVRK